MNVRNGKTRVFQNPSVNEQRALYNHYLQLYENPFFSASKKRSVFTALFGYEVWSWRVVGITVKAVLAIHNNGYRYPTRVLVRDHRMPRKDTYSAIFSRKHDFEEWWNFIWESDKTTLMTHDEHNIKGGVAVSRIIPLDPTDSFFLDKEVAGFYYTMAKEGKKVGILYQEELTESERTMSS